MSVVHEDGTINFPPRVYDNAFQIIETLCQMNYIVHHPEEFVGCPVDVRFDIVCNQIINSLTDEIVE